MNSHKVLSQRSEDDFFFYDIEFSFSSNIQTFRLIFAPVSMDGDAADCIEDMLGGVDENIIASVVTFYDPAWDSIPVNEREGKAVFERVSGVPLLLRKQLDYFFDTLVRITEEFVEANHVKLLYFTAYSLSHIRSYNRVLQRLQSTVLCDAETKGVAYVIKTKYY
ncbi:hypothetical protein ACUNI3_12230 [Serratia sp. IR-2025]|uniref:hypothetical protein n=1 Tax=Serratia nevei TaxID=2703794 RepID=UPI002AA0DD97|nr:hypothetical protein [Serratia nevei]